MPGLCLVGRRSLPGLGGCLAGLEEGVLSSPEGQPAGQGCLLHGAWRSWCCGGAALPFSGEALLLPLQAAPVLVEGHQLAPVSSERTASQGVESLAQALGLSEEG